MHRKHYQLLLLLPLFALAAFGQDLNIEDVKSKLGLSGFNESSLPDLQEDVEKIFKEKCIKEANEEAYDKAVAAKDVLQACIDQLINFAKLQDEIEEAKPDGKLDEVFKKYCDKSPRFKDCIFNFTAAMEPCMNEKERSNTKVLKNVTDSLMDFVCYNEGYRIALFIGEGGPECVSEKTDEIQRCVNTTMSKYIPKEMPSLDNLPDLLITVEQCDDMNKLQDCIVAELEKCDDPTPANVAESLFKFIKRETPCGKSPKQKQEHQSSNSASSVIVSSLVLVISAVYFV